MDSNAVKRRAIAGFCAALGLVLPWLAADASPKEYQVKAAYLYNFTKFIDWPDSAFASASAPITICVLGDDPFEGVLDKAIGGKQVKGRALSLRKVEEDTTGCQILFIAGSEEGKVGDILSAASGPVATVSEVDGFAEQGGVLNFALKGSKVKVELNMDAAERAGLKVSGKLQQVAVAVGG